MKSKLIFIAVALAFISGCAMYHPLPLINVTEKNSDGQNIPIQKATSIATAKDKLKAYGDQYLKHSGKLLHGQYTFGDVAFFGGLLGLAGGVAKSLDVASAGVVLGLAPTIPTRYELPAQAANYKSASIAMYCMRELLVENNDLFDEAVKRNVDEVVNFVNDRIDEVTTKLQHAQMTVQLQPPDLGAFKNAAKEIAKIKMEQENRDKVTRSVETAFSEINNAIQNVPSDRNEVTFSTDQLNVIGKALEEIGEINVDSNGVTYQQAMRAFPQKVLGRDPIKLSIQNVMMLKNFHEKALQQSKKESLKIKLKNCVAEFAVPSSK